MPNSPIHSIARIVKERQINLVHLNNAVRSRRGALWLPDGQCVLCMPRSRLDKFEMVDEPLLRFINYLANNYQR